MAKGFREFRIQGRTYRLSHLRPLILSGRTRAFPQERVKVIVTFNSHCWSESLDRAVHTPDLAFADELRRRRAFSAERHADSLTLPGLFETAWGRTVSCTSRKNHVMVVGEGDDALSVFLTLMPSRQRRADVHCLVQSAYRRASLPRHLGPTTSFPDAVDAALGAGLWSPTAGSRREARASRYGHLDDIADDHALFG